MGLGRRGVPPGNGLQSWLVCEAQGKGIKEGRMHSLGIQVNTPSCAHGVACISTQGLQRTPWGLSSGPGGERGRAPLGQPCHLELEWQH